MEVRIPAELEARLDKLAAESGQPKEKLIQDAMSAYLDDIGEVRKMLESRYNDLKSGRVKPIAGEEAFARLRQRSKARRNHPS